MGTGSFPGVKSGRGVTLTPHLLLVPWSRKSRAIPLLPLRAYGLYRASVTVQGCILPFFHLMTAPGLIVGRDSSVDSLRAGRSRNRVPVGARFSAPIQTGSGLHPASHTMSTRFLRPGRGVNHPPPSSATIRERVEVYVVHLLHFCGFMNGYRAKFTSLITGANRQ